jgi:hypothetical protein
MGNKSARLKLNQETLRRLTEPQSDYEMELTPRSHVFPCTESVVVICFE